MADSVAEKLTDHSFQVTEQKVQQYDYDSLVQRRAQLQIQLDEMNRLIALGDGAGVSSRSNPPQASE